MREKEGRAKSWRFLTCLYFLGMSRAAVQQLYSDTSTTKHQDCHKGFTPDLKYLQVLESFGMFVMSEKIPKEC